MDNVLKKSIKKMKGTDLKEINTGLKQPDILVINDNFSFLNLINFIIDMKGITCYNSRNMHETEYFLNNKTYDIVFLDLELRDGSGFKILKKIVRNSPQTLVVVFTGMDACDIIIKAIRNGAYDYIRKPFTVTLFQKRLEKIIEEWKSRALVLYYQGYLEGIVEKLTAEMGQKPGQTEHLYDEIVLNIGAAFDLQYPETKEHSHRVSENSIRLGKKLGLSESQIRDIKWGAYLHDIGEVCISAAILLKYKGLIPAEMNTVMGHPAIGYRMIRNIDFLTGAGEILMYHHEKYNGEGYLKRLQGKEIPLAARIFSVIDTLDAMTSDRPYRKPLPYSAVVEELKTLSGAQFDPEIVERFLEIPESAWLIKPV